MSVMMPVNMTARLPRWATPRTLSSVMDCSRVADAKDRHRHPRYSRRSPLGPGSVSGAKGGPLLSGGLLSGGSRSRRSPGLKRTGGTYMRSARHSRAWFSLRPQARKLPALVQADAHLLEAVAGAAALHDDHIGRQAGVGGHEVLHQLGRAHRRTRVGEVDEARRDLDLLIEPAGEVEVAVDAEARSRCRACGTRETPIARSA